MPNVAVVLFQLGGPDSLEAVEGFLYNLFCDPDIIDFPGAFIARKILARRIASRRAHHVAEHYRDMGGNSPINALTEHQATALEHSLRENGIQATVVVAMRYWKPLTEDAIQRLHNRSFDQVVLLPLYPHFSRATTYSSFNEWKRKSRKAGFPDVPAQLVCCYPNHPSYIEALVDNIHGTFERYGSVDPGEIDLVFSAHGVPIDFIKKGDPYQLHIEETVRSVMQRGKWPSPHVICYQSKVGSSRWLEPSLTGTIRDLAQRGHKYLLVVPVAFVTEHVETLHEIDIEAREDAVRAGIKQFEMMPALNSHPAFIRCLTELVLERVSAPRPFTLCRLLSAGSAEPSLCPWHRAGSGGKSTESEGKKSLNTG